MSKVGGLGIHKIGGYFILNRLLIFNMFFVTTSNFGGAQPPLSKSGGGGGLKPPLPPQVLCLCYIRISNVLQLTTTYHIHICFLYSLSIYSTCYTSLLFER